MFYLLYFLLLNPSQFHIKKKKIHIKNVSVHHTPKDYLDYYISNSWDDLFFITMVDTVAQIHDLFYTDPLTDLLNGPIFVFF